MTAIPSRLTSMNEKQHACVEEWVETLSAEKAEEGLLVSLYVPPAEKERAIRMVAVELKLSDNIRDRVTRQLVAAALKDVIRAMTYPLGHEAMLNGFAIFADGKGIARLVAPPMPIMGFVYRCERTYYLTPLTQMLVPRSVVGLIVLDRGEATFGWTDCRRIVELHNMESYVMGKHHMGGMSQARYARLIEQQVVAFFTKVGEEAAAVFLPLLGSLESIVVGGPALTKAAFVEGDYLDYRLKGLLSTTLYSTGYTGEQGLKELCARAGLTE